MKRNLIDEANEKYSSDQNYRTTLVFWFLSNCLIAINCTVFPALEKYIDYAMLYQNIMRKFCYIN